MYAPRSIVDLIRHICYLVLAQATAAAFHTLIDPTRNAHAAFVKSLGLARGLKPFAAAEVVVGSKFA